MKRANRLIFWIVECEGHSAAWVNAPDWEQATVKAAEFWGVPWKEVAARCECRMRKQAVKGVCPRCGRYFFGGAKLCALCEAAARDEEQNLRQYLKNRYRHVRKNEGGLENA